MAARLIGKALCRLSKRGKKLLESKFNKIVWSINGVGILLTLIFVLNNISTEIIPNVKGLFKPEFDSGIIVGKGSEKAKELNLEIQHLTYSRPIKIINSGYYLSEISIVDKEIPKAIRDAMKAANDVRRIDATINVLFIKSDRTEVHTLLDNFGYIASINFPEKSGRFSYYDKDAIENQKFILYEISTRDTNGDSRINEKDSTAYYISDLSGKNLRQITPDSLFLNSYWYSEDYDVIYFEEILKGEKIQIYGREYQIKDRKIYYYDLKTGKFEIFKKLQDKFEELQDSYQF